MTTIANVPLRLPIELRDFIATDAKFNRRSMNSHIIALIEEKQRSMAKNNEALTAGTVKAS